jgi:hypothetical protein
MKQKLLMLVKYYSWSWAAAPSLPLHNVLQDLHEIRALWGACLVVLLCSTLRLLRKQPNHNIQTSQMLVGLFSYTNHHLCRFIVYSRNFTLLCFVGGQAWWYCIVRYCDCSPTT